MRHIVEERNVVVCLPDNGPTAAADLDRVGRPISPGVDRTQVRALRDVNVSGAVVLIAEVGAVDDRADDCQRGPRRCVITRAIDEACG
jgi:hypothetical protein